MRRATSIEGVRMKAQDLARENLVDKPNIDIVVGRTLGLGKGKDGTSEKQIYLIAYKGS
jgi:hypothetical protein